MKTSTAFIVLMLFFLMSAFGQKVMVNLTFTAQNSAAYVQLDSIKVIPARQCDRKQVMDPRKRVSFIHSHSFS